MGSVELTTNLKEALVNPAVTGKKGDEIFPLGKQGYVKIDEMTLWLPLIKVNKTVSPTLALTLGGSNAILLFAPTVTLTVAAREEPTKAKPATMYEKNMVYRGRIAEEGGRSGCQRFYTTYATLNCSRGSGFACGLVGITGTPPSLWLFAFMELQAGQSQLLSMNWHMPKQL